MTNLKFMFTALLLLLTGGCAILQTQFEQPKVRVTSVRLLPSESMAPRFEIGLHVINPNLTPLALKGISYSIRVEGHEILTGVSSDLPVIAGYGEGDMVLQASTDLFSGLRLLNDLMSRPRETLTYDLEARLDVGRLLPQIRIRESGDLLLE